VQRPPPPIAHARAHWDESHHRRIVPARSARKSLDNQTGQPCAELLGRGLQRGAAPTENCPQRQWQAREKRERRHSPDHHSSFADLTAHSLHERGKIVGKARRRTIGHRVIHAESHNDQIGRLSRQERHELVHRHFCGRAGQPRGPPSNRPSSQACQCTRGCGANRLIAARNANAGNRRIVNSEYAQQRACSRDKPAMWRLRRRQTRHAASGEDTLHGDQWKQRERTEEAGRQRSAPSTLAGARECIAGDGLEPGIFA